MSDLTNVNTIFFTILNYPMSYIEFFGTIFNAWCVILAAKNKILTWPVGIIGTVLFGFLFYQVRLYSDLVEQVYYLVINFWGWWLWLNPKNKKNNKQLKISKTSKKSNIITIFIILVTSVGFGYLMTKVHLILPTIFPEMASYPYLDVFTTVVSFVATIYLAKRQLENWYLWIIVDVIGVWLYYQKDVVFISLLYFAFLINAIIGLRKWQKIYYSYNEIV